MKLVADACKAGTVVEGHLYHGLGHSETVNASLKIQFRLLKGDCGRENSGYL